MKLEAVTTEYRGHARDLGRPAPRARTSSWVVALGGDGTVNEVVNGLLHARPRPRGCRPRRWSPAAPPTSSPAPSACPTTPWRRTGALLDALRVYGPRATGVGLGLTPRHARAARTRRCPPSWFTFSAGLGFHAGVVGPGRAAARARQGGSTHALYLRQAMQPVLRRGPPPARHDHPAERPDADPVTDLVLSDSLEHLPVDVSGQSPGRTPHPRPSFDTALDVLGLEPTCRRPPLPAHGTQLLTSLPPDAGRTAGTRGVPAR